MSLGTHLIVDLYECRRQPYKVIPVLERIAKKLGFRVLDRCDYRFGTLGRNNGETALILLAESHMSVHSWPEKGYVAFDLFSCRPVPADKCAKAVAMIVRAYGCRRHKIRAMERGREKGRR